jgi:hypothetical protein
MPLQRARNSASLPGRLFLEAPGTLIFQKLGLVSDKKATLHEYLAYLPAAVAIIGLGTCLQKRGSHHGNEAVGPLGWGYTGRIAIRVVDYLFTALTDAWSDPVFI